MPKILQGKVIANNSQNTAIVEVVRRFPHPLYKKLLKRSKKYKVETGGSKVPVGQAVSIIETRPISKDKHFRILVDKKPEAGAKVKKAAVKKEEAEA